MADKHSITTLRITKIASKVPLKLYLLTLYQYKKLYNLFHCYIFPKPARNGSHC